jgi:hypothetical protein
MVINDDDDDEPTDLGYPFSDKPTFRVLDIFRCPNICQTSEASILKNY